MSEAKKDTKAARPADMKLARQRMSILDKLTRWLELPMNILGFCWLVLIILDLIGNLPHQLVMVGTAIWVLFIVDFLLRFTLAPRKIRFLRKNWLTVISLVVPAIRLVRILRILQAWRGVQLVKVLGSINRGMHSLERTLGGRGLGYVAGLSVLVLLAGSAGMYFFERNTDPAFADYGEAIWWTSTLMTNLGPFAYPKTLPGKVLTVLLALYALALTGYVAGALVSAFLERAGSDRKSGVASQESVDQLGREIQLLKRGFTDNGDPNNLSQSGS